MIQAKLHQINLC